MLLIACFNSSYAATLSFKEKLSESKTSAAEKLFNSPLVSLASIFSFAIVSVNLSI
jgi:hypothetical protein